MERATVSWFAIRVSFITFGIFDVFHDEDGRKAYLAGAVAKALTSKAPELSLSPAKKCRSLIGFKARLKKTPSRKKRTGVLIS
jgi:hypothetical protein